METDKVDRDDLDDIFKSYLKTLNAMLANYEKVGAIEIRDSEFEKTPKKSIKRFLYC